MPCWVSRTLGWSATDKEEATDRLDNAAKVLHEVMAAPDKGIPSEVMDHAKCVAVVPHMVKGGFVVGAEGGKGVATCRTAHGWSAPAFFMIAGGSWGLQIGVEGIDLVMISRTSRVWNTSSAVSSRSAQMRLQPQVRWDATRRRDGLEDGCGNPDLLAGQGCIRWINVERRRREGR